MTGVPQPLQPQPQPQQHHHQQRIGGGTKTVYFIRHAESLENHKHKSVSKVLADLKAASLPESRDVIDIVELLDIPKHVDTPVTSRGKQQIANVAAQLQADNFVCQTQIELVVHSPLQRACETAQGLLQCRYKSCQAPTVGRVVQLDLLRERTPDEIWIPWRKAAYNQRKHAFVMWLLQQPESVIAVVGHSEYFKSMLHLPFKFGHCDVWRAELRPLSRKKWFGLERLYRPQLKIVGSNTNTNEEEEEEEEEEEYLEETDSSLSL